MWDTAQTVDPYGEVVRTNGHHFVGIGMYNPSDAGDVHEPSEEILREIRPRALQKGGARRNIL